MKKVLFAINTLNNGGAEKVLLTLLRYLDPKKYEIHLLVGSCLEKGFTLNRFLNM